MLLQAVILTIGADGQIGCATTIRSAVARGSFDLVFFYFNAIRCVFVLWIFVAFIFIGVIKKLNNEVMKKIGALFTPI